MASPRFRDTGRFVRRPAPTKTFTPANLADLMRCLDPASRTPTPVRVRGAGSAPTDCNANSSGSIIDMTGLDRIVHIDAHNRTVTAEAGVRLVRPDRADCQQMDAEENGAQRGAETG